MAAFTLIVAAVSGSGAVGKRCCSVEVSAKVVESIEVARDDVLILKQLAIRTFDLRTS